MGACGGLYAPRLINHVRERETREVIAHVIAHIGPHAKQDALALVVTGPVLVGLAKVARGDWSVNRGHDFGQRD